MHHLSLLTESWPYDSYEDIPNDFEHVIEFVPIPEPGEDGGHTEEQHGQTLYGIQDCKLMERERGTATRIGVQMYHTVRIQAEIQMFVNDIAWSCQGDVNTVHLQNSTLSTSL